MLVEEGAFMGFCGYKKGPFRHKPNRLRDKDKTGLFCKIHELVFKELEAAYEWKGVRKHLRSRLGLLEESWPVAPGVGKAKSSFGTRLPRSSTSVSESPPLCHPLTFYLPVPT